MNVMSGGIMNTQVIDDWLRWYEAAGASRGTICVRRSHLTRLAARVDPVSASTDDLVAFLADYRSLRPESRKSMLESLRMFYRWALARGLRDDDPTVGLRRVQVPPGVPRPIPEASLRQALSAADEEQTLMLLLGAYAGLRRSEIAAVNSQDVDGLTLTVRGKGGRVRRVPVHPMLAGRLARINGWAFPSPVREGRHVHPDYVANRLEQVLPAPFTCHSLRHRFATVVYDSTKDLRAVQELLGHSRPETTARYTLVTEERLTAAVLAVA